MPGQAATETRSDTARASSTNDIEVRNVGLRFLDTVVALHETSLDVPAGSFCTLLGPSGSGKTTLLQVIAGLLKPSMGQVLIKGTDVTDMPVQSRNVGFVFQNYALFPHMTVAENIEYPLTLHGWSAPDRQARVREILDLIELPDAGARQVGELSGGQQQRIAIGRALSYRPSIMLLDEPMGALDRRLRQQLGAQLRSIQQKTGITAVYVTHDQEEAFILSDRIAIMNQGSILQYDTPSDLYFRPRRRFVASFLGEANLVPVIAARPAASGEVEAETPLGPVTVPSDRHPGVADGELSMLIRPEDVLLFDAPVEQAGTSFRVPVSVQAETFLGSRSALTLSTEDGLAIRAECPSHLMPRPGAQMFMSVRSAGIVLVSR